MSDRKDDFFTDLNISSQSTDLEGTMVNDGIFNKKHVSFAQKTALLQYFIAHKKLFMQDPKNEKFWCTVVNQLNEFSDEAVRSVNAWQKTWQLWSTNVLKRRNDLSMTMLDLELLRFVDNIYEIEKLRNTLETFFRDTKNSLSSDTLNSIREMFPELKENNNFIGLIQQLKKLEDNELILKSETDDSTDKLSQLINQKQEIDNEVTKIVKKLDQYETKISELKIGKTDILNQIRNYMRPLFN